MLELQPTEALLTETSPPRRPRRRWIWMGAGSLAVAGIGLLAFSLVAASHQAPGQADASSLARLDPAPALPTVNTVIPERKTLVRLHSQPGSIEPWAQVELYTKVSGYLKSIQRDPSPQMLADVIAQHSSALTLCPAAALAPAVGQSAIVMQVAHAQAPEKDIGSYVKEGEVLLEIDSPERQQDIVQCESVLSQRLAEMQQARSMVATSEAAIESIQAQKIEAESDLAYHSKQLARLQELARREAITPQRVEEKQHEVNAARAKLQVIAAEVAVARSRLETARADLQVKEALVQVARDELRRAQILASYARIIAPFDGVITHRDVDVGDFVQNSTTGQTRRLMTITAIDRVRVVLQVPSREAVWVRPGAEAMVQVDAHPGRQFHGQVARVGQLIEPRTRTMQVEIDLDNSNHHLLPGMYGQVTLTLQKVPNALSIPATAVYSRNGKNYILEVHDGVIQQHPVRILFDDGKELEVVKLLQNSEVPLNGTEELVVSNKGEIAAAGQSVRTLCLNRNHHGSAGIARAD